MQSVYIYIIVGPYYARWTSIEGVRGQGRERTGGIFMFVINISRVIIISRLVRQQPACQLKSRSSFGSSRPRHANTHTHTHTHQIFTDKRASYR